MPFQDSVKATLDPLKPPKASAFVLSVPAPLKSLLAVVKSATSVQLVPFQDSVIAVSDGEPPGFPP